MLSKKVGQQMGPEPGGEKGPITTTEQTGTFCLLNIFYWM